MNCIGKGCDAPATNKMRQLCKKHYTRFLRHGDPEVCAVLRQGQNSHPDYYLYRQMLKRCSNPNVVGYEKYGGRGITVCDRWIGKYGFTNFISDMGDRPKGMSIDRIDNDGNYEPSNCRWATPLEQAHNRGVYSTNKAGANGVSKTSNGKRWRVRIKVANKEIFIGAYMHLEDAVEARRKAEVAYWHTA